MENGPSKSPETPFRPLETGGPEKNKDEKDSKDSKKSKSKKPLGKLFEKTEKAEVTEAPKKDESVLEKLLGDKTKETPEPKREQPARESKEPAAAAKAAHMEPEGEFKIDHLSQSEEREIASDYIDIRHADVEEELQEVQKDTEGEQAAIHDEKWLDRAKAQIESNPETPVDESLEEATQEVVAEMQQETALPAEPPKSQFETMAEEALQQTPAEAETPAAAGFAESALPPAAMFAAVQEQARYAGEAATSPTAPDQTETGRRSTQRPETSKSSWYPPLVPWGSEVWHARRWHLMRHRRERLKTEEKIKQAERNLQKEVRAVQEQVAGHEVGVRRMAAEQMRQRTEQQARGGEVPPHAHERYVATWREAILPAPPTPPEGHIAKLSEAVAPRGPIERPTAAEAMPREELLKESAGITVSGVTLRSIYESKRISEPGLRRLVDEYRRGGDMQLALAQEMVEHEREFERDPLLRDDHPMYEWLHPGGTASTSATAAAGSAAGSATASSSAPALSSKEFRRARRQEDHLLSDGQFMTAGFTLLIIIIALIFIVLSSR